MLNNKIYHFLNDKYPTHKIAQSSALNLPAVQSPLETV
jgi:hypothetical protein